MGRRSGMHVNCHKPQHYHKSSHQHEKAARLRSSRSTGSSKQLSRKQEKTSSYQASKARKEEKKSERRESFKSFINSYSLRSIGFGCELFVFDSFDQPVLTEALLQNGLRIRHFKVSQRENSTFQRDAMTQTLYAYEFIMHPKRHTCKPSSYSTQLAGMECSLRKFVACVSAELRVSPDYSVDMSCDRIRCAWKPKEFGALLVHEILDKRLPPGLLKFFLPLNKVFLNWNNLFEDLACTMESILPHLPEYLRSDTNVMYHVMGVCGPSALQWSALRFDRPFILRVASQHGMAVRFASQEMRFDYAIGLAAVKATPAALAVLSPSLQDDKQIVMSAVNRVGATLRHASIALRKDAQVVRQAALQDITALKFAHHSLLQSSDFMLDLIQETAEAYEFIGSAALRKTIVVRAVRLNPRVMRFLSESVKHQPRVILTYLLAHQSDHRSATLRLDWPLEYSISLCVAQLVADRDFVVGMGAVNLASLLKVNAGFSGRIKQHIMSFLCPVPKCWEDWMKPGVWNDEKEYREMLVGLSRAEITDISKNANQGHFALRSFEASELFMRLLRSCPRPALWPRTGLFA